MERRIYLIYASIFVFFSIITLKLFYWQVLSYDRLEGIADRQRILKLPVPALRGSIYASDMTPLVINQKAYGVYFEPYKIKDQYSAVKIVSKELGIEESSVSAKLSDKNLVWVPVEHKVDEEKIEKIRKYNIEGVNFLEESKRFYPEASMAAHLIGFVGKDTKGDDAGYFGLEGFYDQQIRGRDGQIIQEIDAQGNPIMTGEVEKIPSESGRDLILYLDKTIQFVVENKLREGIEKYKAKGGSVIVMDPFTGGILASASLPSYDPASFRLFPTDNYQNPAIAHAYEPGSTFKTLIMSAALSEGVIKPDTKYDENGQIDIGEYSIKTWNQKYHGLISMTQILEYSSNTGMVFIQKQMDKNKYYEYFKNFGLGQLTNIDLQDEATPMLRHMDKWYEIDYATSSFGQGVAVTPLQMVRAVAAIANGGNLIEPKVVKSIRLSNGEIIKIEPKIIKRIFKNEAASIVKEMMVSAVDNGETKFVKPVGYRIAGKTGTAQIPIAGHYDTEKTIASFVGFAPIDKPRFVMLVTLVEPSSSPWGSETAAPLFFSIAKELFSYMNISPGE